MEIKKKSWPEMFEKVLDGTKKFDLRLADFECKAGDTLVLQEWDSKSKKYTGRELRKKVTYVLKTKEVKLWPEKEIKKYGFQLLSLE
jgi:ribosomal protein S17